ncbi:MAG: chromate transporter, partial [Sedimentibacter sp.]
MKDLLEIYFTFFKISSITFGGGMAMLPILQNELVKSKKWVTDEEIIDYFALGQSLPGIIAVNVASFIGYRKKGVLGEIFAGLGIVSPCIIIILVIASRISNFKNIEIVQHAFAGITIGVSALIFGAVKNLWEKS